MAGQEELVTGGLVDHVRGSAVCYGQLAATGVRSSERGSG